MSNSTDSDVPRRTILKATSSVAGFAAAPTMARAAPGRTLGETLFIEYGFEHDIEGDSRSEYPFVQTDEPLPHTVLADRRELHLLKDTPGEALAAFETHDAVVRRGSVFGPTATGRSGNFWLTTELGRRCRRHRVLQVDERYRPPGLEVSPRGDSVAIGMSDQRARVTPRSKFTKTLPSRSVTVRAKRVLDEKVDAPDIPEWRRGLKTERWRETVTVKPRLVLHNHGRLDVVDSTDRRTV